MHQKVKRIVALLGVIIIALLYLTTFVLSFFHFEGSEEMLGVCIVATVVIPVLLYIYLWLFRLAQQRDKENEEKRS